MIRSWIGKILIPIFSAIRQKLWVKGLSDKILFLLKARPACHVLRDLPSGRFSRNCIKYKVDKSSSIIQIIELDRTVLFVGCCDNLSQDRPVTV